MSKLSFHALRKMGRRTYTATLISPFDKCHYCDDPIVWSELLTGVDHVQKGPQYVTWVDKGVSVKMKTATIEHIVPLYRFGGNLLSNLTGACHWCNTERSKIQPVQDNKLKRMPDRRKYKRYDRT